MENTIDIQWAKPQHHNLIRDFYQDRGYQGGFTAEDQILLALDQEAIAGVVRLCEEEGVFILRGMQVHPRFQRQGLGFRMLRVFEHAIGPKECFVLPFDHLGDFYGLIKFEPLDEKDLPDFLRERINRYRDRGNKMIAMRRPEISRPSLPALKKTTKDWGIEETPLFVRKVENYVYEFHHDPVILRITNTAHRSQEQLQTELQWIDYLKKKNLSVAAPIVNPKSYLMEELDHEGIPHKAAFFHRAPGRLLKVDDDQQPLVHWKLGELLGQIHNETRVYQGPRHRDHWNEERGFVLARRVQGDPKDPMTRAWREVIQWLDHLPTDIEHYGLIHGDAHQGNFFVTDQKEITLFDFDDSQLSWYAYELAIPLFSLLGREINGEENPILYEECRESLIDGYLQTQNKRPDWIDWIPKFIEFRTVLLYFWAQARYQKKDLEPDGLKRIRRMMAWCKARTLASR